MKNKEHLEKDQFVLWFHVKVSHKYKSASWYEIKYQGIHIRIFFRDQYLSNTIVQIGLVDNGLNHINTHLWKKEIPCKFLSNDFYLFGWQEVGQIQFFKVLLNNKWPELLTLLFSIYKFIA